jgi:hypothetical protein
MLFGRAGVASGVLAAAMWAFVLLMDAPSRGLSRSLAWFVPASGKWGRYALMLLALWVLFSFPLWAGWVLE